MMTRIFAVPVLLVFALAWVVFLILAALAAEHSFFDRIWNSRGGYQSRPREKRAVDAVASSAAREIFGGR